MSNKRKILIGVVLLVSFALVRFFGSSQSPQNARVNALDEQRELRVFSDKDLYANQNFSKNIDRLRTSSFTNPPAKKTKAKKLEANKANKQAKLDPKKKKKKKKKAKKKDEKKETTNQELTADVDTDKDEGLSGESLIDPTTSGIADNQEVAAEEDSSVSFWTSLLLTQANETNFDLFYQAFLNSEISAQGYYQVHKNLFESASSSVYPLTTDLLIKDTSLAAFSLLFDYQSLKNKALKSDQLSKINSNLVSYTSTLQGLNALVKVFSLPGDGEKKAFTAALLTDSSSVDIANLNVVDDRNTTRGEVSSLNQAGSTERLQVYQNLLLLLSDTTIQGDLGEARSETLALFNYLSDKLPEGRLLPASERDSSRG